MIHCLADRDRYKHDILHPIRNGLHWHPRQLFQRVDVPGGACKDLRIVIQGWSNSKRRKAEHKRQTDRRQPPRTREPKPMLSIIKGLCADSGDANNTKSFHVKMSRSLAGVDIFSVQNV